MLQQIKKIILVSAMVLAVYTVQAQDPNGPDPSAPEGPGGPGSTDAPIDGGVSLLVAAGVAYGAKKAHDARKKKAE